MKPPASHRDWDFKKLYALLPLHIQEQAAQTFLLWRSDRWHPSLRFKEWRPGYWSVRVTKGYRALAEEQPDGSYLWYWIGPHGTYDKRLREKR